MKSNTFKEYIAPVVVLVCICLVITAALAVTYGVTNPIIIKNSKATADKTRTELLSTADTFTQYNGKLVVEEAKAVYVQDVYTAGNGSGMTGAVLEVKTKFSKRFTCRNIQFHSGCAFFEHRRSKSDVALKYRSIIFFHLIVKMTQHDSSGDISCSVYILSAAVNQQETIR